MTETTTTDRPRDYIEPMPPPPRGRVSVRVVVLAVVAMVLLFVVVGVVHVKNQINPTGAPGEDVSITIPKGSSTTRIGEMLAARGIIDGPKVFGYWTKITGKGPFLAGDYVLQENSSYDEVASVLTVGPPRTSDRFTIPEGFGLRQVAERVGQLPGHDPDSFFEVATSGRVRWSQQPADVSSLEGLLFPSTYFVEEKDDDARILQRMVDAFDQVAQELRLVEGASALEVSPYEIVIIASLIEREAKLDADRPKIAQVIYNRLAKGMVLNIDAAVSYGLNKATLTTEDLQTPNPYNTYVNKGLPPTPISSPGKASIEAALNPEPSPFIYYVTIDKEGRNAFSTTLAEHNRNKVRARANGALP